MRKLYLVFILAVLLGCSKEQNPSGEVVSDELITLATSVTAADSKASMVVDQSDFTTVGLYCAHTGSESWSTSTTDFSKMEDKKLTYTNNEWQYESGEEVTWGHSSITDKYTFFGYAPHSSIDDATITPTITDGELHVTYICPPDATTHQDLLLAKPRKDIYPQMGGKLYLTMDHALSCISFSAKGTEGVKITKIQIDGVYSNGSATHNGTEIIWTQDEDNTKHTAYVETSKGLVDAELNPDTNTDLTDDDGYLMMMPQTIPSGAMLGVTYLDSNDTEGSALLDLTTTTIAEWEAGKRYNYSFTVNANIEILTDPVVTVTEWGAPIVDNNSYTDNTTEEEAVYLIDLDVYNTKELVAATIEERLSYGVTEFKLYGEAPTNLLTKNSGLSGATYTDDNGTTIGATSLDLSEVTGLTSVGAQAFLGNTYLTEITLPESIIYIYSNAFANATKLTSIYSPGVTTIDWNGFAQCTSLKEADFPEATDIGEQAFYICESLVSVNLPKATNIGVRAFYVCEKLESIELPAATTIGESAFANCPKLSSVKLPAATDIGKNAFFQTGTYEISALNDVDIYLTSESDITIIANTNSSINVNTNDWRSFNLYLNKNKTLDANFKVYLESISDDIILLYGDSFNYTEGTDDDGDTIYTPSNYTWQSVTYLDNDGNEVTKE